MLRSLWVQFGVDVSIDYSQSGRIANTNFQAGSTRYSLMHEGDDFDRPTWLDHLHISVFSLFVLTFVIIFYIYSMFYLFYVI